MLELVSQPYKTMFDGVNTYKYLEGDEYFLHFAAFVFQTGELQPGGHVVVAHFFRFGFVYVQILASLSYFYQKEVVPLYWYSLVNRYFPIDFLKVFLSFLITVLLEFPIESEILSIFASTRELEREYLFEFTLLVNQLLHHRTTSSKISQDLVGRSDVQYFVFRQTVCNCFAFGGYERVVTVILIQLVLYFASYFLYLQFVWSVQESAESGPLFTNNFLYFPLDNVAFSQQMQPHFTKHNHFLQLGFAEGV